MNRFAVLAVSLLLATTLCLAQTSTSPATSTTASSTAQATAADVQSALPHGVFPVALANGLDSKKLKEGDKVVCTTTALVRMGGLTIPSGAKVIGHVTQAKARSNGDAESSLGMQFDQIQMPGGKTIAMKGIPQAFAPHLGGSGADTGAASPGTMPGHGGETLMPPPTDTAVSGPNSGYHPLNNRGPIPILTSQSVGVLGLRNLEMDKDSVLTTSGKEVKLDSGTQVLIRAEIQVPVG